MDSTTRSKIEDLINSKPIFVFMKGNKLMPQCGFSNNVVQILNSLGISFDTFDVLSDMDSTTRSKIELLINSKPIFVFMKGNKLMPQCGFSNNVVQILNSLGMSFDTFDVLSDMEIREGIKEFSNWPTIPQVYVKGEFIGGSDILISMYNSGELKEKLEIALAS